MRTQNFQSGNKEKANQEKAWQWISIRRIPTNTKNAHTSIEDALIKNAPLQKRRTQKEPTRSCPTPQDGPDVCETPEDWTLMSDAFRRRICEDARQGLPRGPAGHELGGPFWVTACP